MADEESRELAPVAEGPGALLSAIVQLAKDKDFDVAKLDALMKMQERMEDRQAERAYAVALHAAQAEIPAVDKLGTVDLGAGKGSYAFARWEDMHKVLQPIMDRHGFTLTFDMQPRDGGGSVITGTLLHTAGHGRTASIPLALDTGPGRNNLQAMGSTMSYGRRYCAEMLFNIVRRGQDDDGKLGGTRFIAAEQVQKISDLLALTKTDIARFLEYLRVNSIEEIEEGSYVQIVGMLNAKKAKQT